MIPVEGHKNLYRDEESNAIISTDVSEHQKYIEARNRKKSERAEIDELKGEIKEIKEMLRSIVNGN